MLLFGKAERVQATIQARTKKSHRDAVRLPAHAEQAIMVGGRAHTIDGAASLVTALGNLCSAIEHFVIRFRRLMKVIGRRIRRT